MIELRLESVYLTYIEARISSQHQREQRVSARTVPLNLKRLLSAARHILELVPWDSKILLIISTHARVHSAPMLSA